MKFYQLTPEQRREILKDEGIELDQIDDELLTRLNQLSENVIGSLTLPMGVVEGLIVNDKKYWVPMASEEPSVVAAANHGAKIFARNGGVTAKSCRNGIFGQIVMKIGDSFEINNLKHEIPALIDLTNKNFASLVNHGGGLKEIAAEIKADGLLYLKVLVDPAEAMGANKTNAILEFLAKNLLNFDGIEEKLFAILSNYPSQLTTAKVDLRFSSVGGEKVAKRIALLSKIAYEDVYRATTNNKGIMNGVDSTLIATGNDYRAIEAASATLASESGQYRSLSKWIIKDGKLHGELTLPMAIGTVGGSINARGDVKQAFSILGDGINTTDLANVITSIGLANNLTAILAISTVGIQEGHMKLQARNLVADLDATDAEKAQVLKVIIAKKQYTREFAQEVLTDLRKEK